MKAFFIEGTTMALMIAKKMKAPYFMYSDYVGITDNAKVGGDLARKLMLTVMKQTSEESDFAVVCVEDTKEGVSDALGTIEAINQRKLCDIEYIYFNTRVEIDGATVVDGIEMLASMLKDQEVPFNTGIPATESPEQSQPEASVQEDDILPPAAPNMDMV